MLSSYGKSKDGHLSEFFFNDAFTWTHKCYAARKDLFTSATMWAVDTKSWTYNERWMAEMANEIKSENFMLSAQLHVDEYDTAFIWQPKLYIYIYIYKCKWTCREKTQGHDFILKVH